MDIVVFGSVTVDLVIACEQLPRPGMTVVAPNYDMLPGGKGANQAAAAAKALSFTSSKTETRTETIEGRTVTHTFTATTYEKGAFGVEVTFIGCVGQDALKDCALRGLKKAGVCLKHVQKLPPETARTACAAILVDAQGENQIVVGGGANLHNSAKYLEDWLTEGADRGKGLLCVLQMEVPFEENLRAIKLVKGWQTDERRDGFKNLILLNVAPACEVPPPVLLETDLLMLNEHEALAVGGKHPEAVGEWSEVECAAQATAVREKLVSEALAQTYGCVVVVTLGRRGCICYIPHQRIGFTADGQGNDGMTRLLVPALSLLNGAVDTVGAGDAFVGAFAASVAQGMNAVDSLMNAVVAAVVFVEGSLTCMGRGAQEPQPTRTEIEKVESYTHSLRGTSSC
eukprot:scaffold2788_cov376-Prasinococcus_capsulatus_cf.AAC.9